MASARSVRHTVDAEMAATTARATSSAASSLQLHRDRGTPELAGSWQASAFTSVSARGGKRPGSSRPLPVPQAVHPLLEEPLAPLDHRVERHPEPLRHRGVLIPVSRPQHDPCAQDLTALRCLLARDSFQASTVDAAQLDHERAPARHHTSPRCDRPRPAPSQASGYTHVVPRRTTKPRPDKDAERSFCADRPDSRQAPRRAPIDGYAVGLARR